MRDGNVSARLKVRCPGVSAQAGRLVLRRLRIAVPDARFWPGHGGFAAVLRSPNPPSGDEKGWSSSTQCDLTSVRRETPSSRRLRISRSQSRLSRPVAEQDASLSVAQTLASETTRQRNRLVQFGDLASRRHEGRIQRVPAAQGQNPVLADARPPSRNRLVQFQRLRLPASKPNHRVTTPPRATMRL